MKKLKSILALIIAIAIAIFWTLVRRKPVSIVEAQIAGKEKKIKGIKEKQKRLEEKIGKNDKGAAKARAKLKKLEKGKKEFRNKLKKEIGDATDEELAQKLGDLLNSL